MKTERNRFPEIVTYLTFSWRKVTLVSFVAVLSYGAAKLGGILIIGPQAEWPLWLGNAFLASILLLVARRMWPILIAVGFSASFIYNVQTGLPIRLSALLVLSDTVEVIVAALCLNYAFGGVPRLNNVRALAKFSLFAVILPPFIGAFSVALAANKNYWTSWRIYFFSEAIVYLTLMPAILGWFSKAPERRQKSSAYYLEAAALIAGLVAFGYLTFDAPSEYSTEALLYCLVPFMLWSALRFGSTGVSTSAIAIAVLALWGAAHGRGVFIESQLLNNALSLQLFLFFTAAPFMVLAAVVEENRQANEQLFRSVYENAQIGIGIFNIRTGEHSSNRALREMVGYTQEELNRLSQWDEIVPTEERSSCAKRYAELVQGKRERDEYEQHFIRRDGRVLLGNSRFQLLRDAAGNAHYVVALTEDITEHRRATEALAASEQLFRTVFDNAQTAIGILNIKTGKYLSNQAVSEMLGYSPQELSRTEQWDEIVHSEDHALWTQRYGALVHGESERDGWEQRYIRRDGELVIGNSRFKLVRDTAGQPHYVVGLSEDVTERRRAEQALAASEQLFRSIFENAQIGISVFNVPAAQFHTNAALHKMLDCTHEDLSSVAKWDLIVHPGERASGAKRYAELVQGRRDEDEYTQRFIRRDGQIVTATGRFTMIRDAEGKPRYIIALHEDITQRKQAEEELRRANFLGETALELTRAGYWHVPLDGSGWYNSSPRRVAIFGDIGRPDYRYPLEELFARAEEADAAAAEVARKEFCSAVDGKSDIYKAVYAYKRPIDGRIAWIHALGQVVRDAEGKPTDMYGVSQDITEFKQMEGELIAAKEAAVAAAKAKSDFLANMSHEIRTPMNAVLGMMHLALKTVLTSKQRDYLTKTKAAAEALLGIINDILDFSKIEAGKLNMEETDFRLEVVLDNLSTVVSQRAQEKNLEYLVAAPADLPAILVGDPLRLGQVLINLVNNAVKFTERGEIVVTVKLEERTLDRVKLQFAVHDSGIGMTPDQTARLFHAFSQADTSTTRKYGGTGLGLSISKRLVEMMDGNIWVESEYGQGTTFRFTAWFGIGSAEEYRKRFSPALTGMRALVVDDNSAAREVLTGMLRELTLRVESVSSGNDALRKLADADTQDPYRLVLMDWQMPGLDGLETCRRIKREHKLRNVPKILLITAFGREEIRAQSQDPEIEGFLQKPVSPSALFDTIMNLFGAAKAEKIHAPLQKASHELSLAGGIRVLLVEDNDVNQQVAKELLESEGAIVTIANDGAEAVNLLIGGYQPPAFDVVLMDLQMPRMDGLTATSLLRADPQLRMLPIIAMTAHAMAEEVQRCLNAGMNDHVAKPIDPTAFFSTISRWTGPSQGEVAARGAKTYRKEEELILPSIEGVDIVTGLQRVAGNKRLYRDLLAQFAAKQGSVTERIAIAIQSGDRAEGERLAHSLKGIAGNLGITEIFSLAGKLEKAIHDSGDDVEEFVKELAPALGRRVLAIHEGLSAAAPTASQQDTVQSADAASVSKAAARLRELLESSDADAPAAYAHLAEMLQGNIESSRLNALGLAVNSFDFQTALTQLDEISKRCGASER